MNRLIVKDFGPLKDVDIKLSKINLFIGENGSGKSILAKIIAIVTDIPNLYDIKDDEEKILKKFANYNINFITEKSRIEYYIDNERFFVLEYGRISTYLLNNYFKNDIIPEELRKLPAFEPMGDIMATIKFISKSSQYIPAERNLISLFSKSLSTLISAEVPLPKFLLHFTSEFEKARNEIKELEFLNIKYINDTKDKIYYNKTDYLDLEYASSGIQSSLPLYLTVKYFANKHQSIIIEEPEQNLFPKSQKETVEYIIEHIKGENKLFMMTHSPYILTALNNLILANDVKNQKGADAIKNIVEEKHCVNFEDVKAYTIIDGKSVDIMDKEDRLIGINLIDSISDEVSNTFDTLLSKLD